MSPSRKILIFGGLALAAFGMLYGLHYAVFVEHQTLDRMGGLLTQGFEAVAKGNIRQAHAAVQAYGGSKYNYVRQVDAHSHWIGLAMLMIVFGATFDKVAFSEKLRRWLAMSLLAGSILFPFGVLLQTATHGGVFASSLAVIGSAMVTVSLAGVAIGFARQRNKTAAA
jgi:hypothetical protein